MEDPNPEVSGAGHARLRQAGLAVEVGVCGAAAKRDHAGHIRRMRDGRPHVMLKLAISADGKVAGAGGRRLAITGEAVRNRVHLFRAQSDAIMVGIGTALADDPVLTCRLPGMTEMSPVRVVLDTRLRLPAKSRLVQTARETPLWIIANASPSSEAALRAHGAEVIQMADKGGFRTVLEGLATRGITRLMVEGGPTLAAALIAADLVDEAFLFYAPTQVGEEGLPAFEPHVRTMLDRHLKCISSQPVGPDRQEHYLREGGGDV
jgi:diaminohydroxyphosphoribosylaminopyrimidine deaminase/5-amino-6-(5-phosphoribosylamino)uracil reductase